MKKTNNKPENSDNSSFQSYLERQEQTKKLERLFGRVLIVTILGLLFYFKVYKDETISSAPNQQLQAQVKPIAESNTTDSCQSELPLNGAFNLENSSITNYGTEQPLVDAMNSYGAPVVLLLGKESLQVSHAFVLRPNTNTNLQIPVGTYSLTLLTGNTWCNLDTGFTDGKRVKIARPIEIVANQSNTIKVDAIGDNKTGIHIDMLHVMLPVLTQEDNTHKIIGNGTLELSRNKNGGFYIEGTVNKIPANYQIDTGASITSIPKELANRAGIFECTPQTFRTANGSVIGCVGIAKELVFGNFRFTGFEVAIMPNMDGVLLGMNVLKHLRLESSQDTMRLSS